VVPEYELQAPNGEVTQVFPFVIQPVFQSSQSLFVMAVFSSHFLALH
jgi:hypothetical protein